MHATVGTSATCRPLPSLRACRAQAHRGGGRRLTDDEIIGFVHLLSAAGSETVVRLLGFAGVERIHTTTVRGYTHVPFSPA